MSSQTALQTAEELLKPYAMEMIKQEEDFRLDVLLSPDQLHEAVKALHDARWGYLSAIAGVDHPAPVIGEDANASGTVQEKGKESQVEVLYVFCQGAAVLVLRLKVPYTHAELPTVCDLIPSATLYERELMEMFGVEIHGTPVKDRLLLPDEWPEGVYPLRKATIIGTTRSGSEE